MSTKSRAMALGFFLTGLLSGTLGYEYTRSFCPQACSLTGSNPANWTNYHSFETLKYCNQTFLFEMAIYNPTDVVSLMACGTEEVSRSPNVRRAAIYPRQLLPNSTTNDPTIPVANSSTMLACGVPGAAIDQRPAELRINWSTEVINSSLSSTNASLTAPPNNLVAAAQQLQAYVHEDTDCNKTLLFSQSGETVVGVYVGSQVQKSSAANLLARFLEYTKNIPSASALVTAEVCPQLQGVVLSTQTLGLFAVTNGDVAAVQQALVQWDSARCLVSDSRTSTPVTINLLSGIQGGGIRGSSTLNGSLPVTARADHVAETTCSYLQVVANDNCWSLATQKCKISTADFYKYNGGSDAFCNTIKPGDYVCCSAGSLPDFSPKPNADGTCASYVVQSGDGCKAIADAHQIKDYTVLDEYNKNTWGWAGCDAGLQLKQVICISKGTPNMPAQFNTITCGPQVVGTQKPTNNTDWALLNPCPLNACCDVWGQCGVTDVYCTDTRAKGAPPGTAKKDTNGCISNCGTEIKNKKSPSSFSKVGYFESWNLDRPCLNMDISKMTTAGGYTHVHFAFANITNSFAVDISGVKSQFDGLKKLTGIKKIISFGGWAFSTAPSTAPIFRSGVTAGQRTAFVNNVVKFLSDNGLDGVDFDWEYPGATDIPGAGSGSPQDGTNYLAFLKELRAALPKDKTLSIAAPASYWYLRNFPIKEIAEIIDYIVYMTYDLHGQWDYDNTYSNPGCAHGNCLRSHVNMTETMYSLAMITKAGVSTDKIFVGMAKYGRSFAMSDPSCRGPLCTFTGSSTQSNAKPGQCTQTGGYISNFELRQILTEKNIDRHIQTWSDKGDNMIYDNNQWVSYLSQPEYDRRAAKWAAEGFGGLSDWAADLENDFGTNGTQSPDNGTITDGNPLPICDWNRDFGSMDDLSAAANGMTPYCNEWYALGVFLHILRATNDNYTSVNSGYDDKFNAYVRYLKDMVPDAIDSYMGVDYANKKAGPGFSFFDCKMNGLGTHSSKPCDQYSLTDLTQGSYDLDLTVRDLDGFHAGMLKATGLAPDWYDLGGTWSVSEICGDPESTTCSPDAGIRNWHGYPELNKTLAVPNPKDVVNGIGSITDLTNLISAMRLEIRLGLFDGDIDDIVQSLSVPVFLLQQAVSQMNEVKKLGTDEEKKEKKKKKDFILSMVGIALMFIPFVGEAGAAATGVMALGRAAALAGDVASIGFSIYEIVEDPNSALMAMVGALLGVRGVAKAAHDATGFASTGKVARNLRTAGTMAKLGAGVKSADDVLQGVLKVCKI